MEPGDCPRIAWLRRHLMAAGAALAAGLLLLCQAPAAQPVEAGRAYAESVPFTGNGIAGPQPLATPDATRASRPATTATALPTPAIVQAKIEIVWPHDGAAVRDAQRANITAYLIADQAAGPSGALQAPPCDWAPTVRLWAALNAQPAREIAIGQKRMVTAGGQAFPAWDFNDVDVSAARDPASKLTFFVTVDEVRTLSNIWTHAADARTLFPQQDLPTGVVRRRPTAVDARIQIVWPHDNLPVEQADRANVTAYLFEAGALLAIPPDLGWTPTVRLHWAVNTDAEAIAAGPPGQASGLIGTPRTVTGTGSVKFLAWDFNDVDISAARDPLNRIYFWVSVDGAPTYANIWAHGVDARTIFPQPDVLAACP